MPLRIMLDTMIFDKIVAARGERYAESHCGKRPHGRSDDRRA